MPSLFSTVDDVVTMPTRFKDLIVQHRMLDGQHPMRAWEYGLALEAAVQARHDALLMRGYDERSARRPLALDVGGAGSCLWAGLEELGYHALVVDPNETMALELYRGAPAPFVTCISVLEHIVNPMVFLRRLADVVSPGGTLVLTADYHPEGDGEDVFHFHWMRTMIFGPGTLRAIVATLFECGLLLPAPLDLGKPWPGPSVYDYGFVGLVLRKLR